MILHTAAHPIVDYQVNLHSFTYRLCRSASKNITLIIEHLKQLKIQKSRQQDLPVKVSKKLKTNLV